MAVANSARPHGDEKNHCGEKFEYQFHSHVRPASEDLTITDFASRYLIGCDALHSTRAQTAFTVFERAFKDFGLPRAIRADNGCPFASASGIFGLSKLSVWWLLTLGVRVEL